MNSGIHYFVIFRNYSALNLVIKIPLQKGLISIMLPHDSFLRFQLPFEKRDKGGFRTEQKSIYSKIH